MKKSRGYLTDMLLQGGAWHLGKEEKEKERVKN